MKARVNYTHLAISACVLGLAVTLAVGAMLLPTDRGYSVVGTHIFPLAVALLVAVVGIGLAWQASTGGLRMLETAPVEEDAPLMRARLTAVMWVSGGLLVDAFLIDHIGFVFASTILFTAVARGFGSTSWKKNAAIGFALTWPIYVGFSKGLGLSLPGLLKPWI